MSCCGGHDHDHDHECEDGCNGCGDGREFITLLDPEGNETLFEILISIDGKEKFEKNYVLLVPADADPEEQVDVLAYSFTENEDGTEGDLNPVESDEEWDFIEEVFNAFMTDEEA
ncbi:MAG: DUF1292 domain-containing protein [Lactobacillales bacterium]|nr:DUF1292 domain-containing protein [Lactobacillales bacterium]